MNVNRKFILAIILWDGGMIKENYRPSRAFFSPKVGLTEILSIQIGNHEGFWKFVSQTVIGAQGHSRHPPVIKGRDLSDLPWLQ